jgi:ParB family chromosome partitioning protein
LFSEKADSVCGQPTVKSFEGILELIDTRLLKTPRNSLRDELDDIGSLAASIRQQGLLQPLVIRPLGDHFEIVAGCRRFEALRSLGWKKIPCVVAELSDEEAYVASLTENLQRETLDPVEEAKAYRKYIDEFGWGGETALATRISKSQEHVSQRLSLLKLPDDVIDLIRLKRLKPCVARELSAIDDRSLQSTVGRDAAERRLTVVEVKELVTETTSRKESARRSSPAEELIERNKVELSIAKKSVLAVRVALVKMDSMIEDARAEDEDDTLYHLLLAERQDLHRILDDIINWKVAKLKEVSKIQSAYCSSEIL